jgi:hypothetical protein
MSRNIILALSRNQEHHFEPFAKSLRQEYEFIYSASWSPKVVKKINPCIILTPTDTWFEAAECIEESKDRHIPSLLIMDGIIEWRHTWEDPQMGAKDGPALFQPVMTDKIACIGRSAYRLLSSWGNEGKCELIGCPRMDHLITNPIVKKSHSGKILLVATNNRPGFTDEQMGKIERSIFDLKEGIKETSWKVIWRIMPKIKDKLGLIDDITGMDKSPLRQVFENVDAVITTPSSLQLESFLAGLPTALLDYTNSPHYVDCSWQITAKDHIKDVLNELRSPNSIRMLHQKYLLNDNLECQSIASDRMVHLIINMIRKDTDIKFKYQNDLSSETLGKFFPIQNIPLDFRTVYKNNKSYNKTNLLLLNWHFILKKLIF